MIIKAHERIKKNLNYSFYLKGVILTCLASILIYGIYTLINNQLSTTDLPKEKFIKIADAEKIKDGKLILGDFKASSANSRSKDYAFDGKYSIKLSKKNNIYGFSTIIRNIRIGDIITAEVWSYSPSHTKGSLVISGLNTKELYAQSKNNPIKKSKGWQLLRVSVKIKNPIQNNCIKIYCHNPNDDAVYFDNLAYKKKSKFKFSSSWKPPKIHIIVKDNEYQKLRLKRQEAINNGVLITTDDSWVKGFIYPEEKEEKIKVSLRLKGDWTDHLLGNKWSFRVATTPEKSWNRLKTFSLQNPMTRSYLLEWMLHKFYNYEDILTTRYEFVNFKLNHKNLGLYVYEEHFLKHLPEYNKKKEGPIIRFVETGFWDIILQQKKLDADKNGALLRGSPEIKPFGENKTFKNPQLAEQYIIAHNLLYEYQYDLKTTKDIFDLDLLAKYYAIVDITGAFHGVTWHNQRFYYNPIISKLEPIGFDGFANGGLSKIPKKVFTGANLSTKNGDKTMYKKFFQERNFLEKYYSYLEKFTDKNYLNKFIHSIYPELQERLLCIQKSKEDYHFSPNYIYKRAANIRHHLYPNSASVQTKTVKPGIIAVCNRLQVPIEIIGTSTNNNDKVNLLDSSIIVLTTPFKNLPDYSLHISVPEKAKFLVYRVIGLKKQYFSNINYWPIPQAFAPVQELNGNLIEHHPSYHYQPNKKLVVFNRKTTIDAPIIIPKGHIVMFKPGITIDIIKDAFILCYSSVQFLGTEEYPITISSSDNSARSFTVLNASENSKIQYTTFTNLGAFSFKGWKLSGAVNFYESDVDIMHSNFTKNSCEDALNIVRSKFDFQHNTISHTFADGFDADFCSGIVSNCYFFKTGNDAIDFSTSKVTIKDCNIKDAGDKGVSMGEQGDAIIINTTIDGANIGIASKDLSKTTIKKVNLINCRTGFAAYQKKPEYGHASLYVQSYTAKNIEKLYKIMPGSYLKLIEQEIKGD
ncbi:MAG: right-handed parallel beta-helix repeat-containing protein [Saprospiraceae bacterium]|nr:right-handed parallel beta-helix repeat-containing protein [Saprospiraceae bacterium]